MPPAHFGYMASGIDDELTLRANREDFKKFQLTPHRLNDVSRVDISVELFGTKYDLPIFVCPTGANQFFHPDGELAVAQGRPAPAIICRSALDLVELLVDDVTKARGAPIWFRALRLAELRGREGADQTGRWRRLSGSGRHG